MVKKICLIWPTRRNKEEYCFPLWAISLATYLKKKKPDIDIYILDGQIYDSETIIKKIQEIKPEIVGISSSYNFYKDSLKFAREAKLINARVVLGGVFATSMKNEILIKRGPFSKDYCVDAIIQRDGEKAFFEYITDISLKKINNLVYQDEDNNIKENKLKLLDLNKLSVPDFTLLNINKYFNLCDHGKLANIYFSKGCSWREKSGGCIFCSSIEKKLRKKTPKKAANEIYVLFNKFGFNTFKIQDEDFLSDINWFKVFFKEHISNYWAGLPVLGISTRADRLTKKIVKMLEELNVRRIALGFETGSKSGLINIKKGLTLSTLYKAANLLNGSTIKVTGHFIFGIPGETKKTLQETFNLIKELSMSNNIKNIRCQRFIPLPSSAAWSIFLNKTDNKYKNEDIINWENVKDDWLDKFCYIKKEDLFILFDKLNNFAKKRNNLNTKFIF